MTETAKRATVYFKSDLDNAIRQKALRTHRTISDVVNDAVRMYLREDQKDLAAFADRRGQLSITYEALLKNLKKHGKLRRLRALSKTVRNVEAIMARRNIRLLRRYGSMPHPCGSH